MKSEGYAERVSRDVVICRLLDDASSKKKGSNHAYWIRDHKHKLHIKRFHIH
jgi:hypothetical protein